MNPIHGQAQQAVREDPKTGFHSFPADESGTKGRTRSESFADHYSQARQFYISQTEVEQEHIAEAFIFELSKVETLAIRERVVSHLPNVDAELAKKVADGLALREMPPTIKAAKTPRTDLPPSKALSIIQNGPTSFKGRQVGVLITDGTDKALLDALKKALEAEGAMLKLIAPAVGGVKASDGTWVEADEKLGGGPSVIFDAVAIMPGESDSQKLAAHPAAQEFLKTAFVHLKVIAYSASAKPLCESAGVAKDLDRGCILIPGKSGISEFITSCRSLRIWDRKVM